MKLLPAQPVRWLSNIPGSRLSLVGFEVKPTTLSPPRNRAHFHLDPPPASPESDSYEN
jgi:hypothetical protein